MTLRRISADEWRELLAQYPDRLELALLTGRKLKTVMSWHHRLVDQPKKRARSLIPSIERLKSEGLSNLEIAKKLGCSLSFVSHQVPKRKRPQYSDPIARAMVPQVWRMLCQGMGWREIADTLDMHPDTLTSVMKRIGGPTARSRKIGLSRDHPIMARINDLRTRHLKQYQWTKGAGSRRPSPRKLPKSQNPGPGASSPDRSGTIPPDGC